MRKVIAGIIHSTENANVEFPQDSARRKVSSRKQAICGIPDSLRAGLIQKNYKAEVPLQFKVRPVIKGVAKRERHGARPGQELFKGRRIARAVALQDSVCTHGPPFVVIALQPNLEQIIESPVSSDVAW